MEACGVLSHLYIYSLRLLSIGLRFCEYSRIPELSVREATLRDPGFGCCSQFVVAPFEKFPI